VSVQRQRALAEDRRRVIEGSDAEVVRGALQTRLFGERSAVAQARLLKALFPHAFPNVEAIARAIRKRGVQAWIRGATENPGRLIAVGAKVGVDTKVLQAEFNRLEVAEAANASPWRRLDSALGRI
jgi:hypothetical protein